MAPAFATAGQAWRFAALLLGLLLAPAIAGWLGLRERREVYASIPTFAGPVAHIEHQIFAEDAPLDIAFIGSSFMWSAIDAAYVQQQLSVALGRPARVTVLASVWPGLDRDYWFLEDLLERRQVGMIVLDLPNRNLPTADPAALVNRVSDQPHVQAFRYHQVGDPDNLGRGWPLRHRLALYAGAVLGLPRHLLSLVRPNYVSPSGVEATLGARVQETGYYGAPFTPFAPPAPDIGVDALVREPGVEHPSFRFYREPLPAYQVLALTQIVDLIARRSVPITLIHIPEANEIHAEFVEERMDWSQDPGLMAPLVGVPPAQLFRGLEEDEVLRLFASDHLNANGAAFFTRAITPALVHLFLANARS